MRSELSKCEISLRTERESSARYGQRPEGSGRGNLETNLLSVSIP